MIYRLITCSGHLRGGNFFESTPIEISSTASKEMLKISTSPRELGNTVKSGHCSHVVQKWRPIVELHHTSHLDTSQLVSISLCI